MKLKTILYEIITEVSIEQLKQHFVESGKITPEDFQEITKATKEKGAYATWLCKKVADKLIKSEDIYKWEKYFDVFNRNKQKFSNPDINAYKTSNDLANLVKTAVEISKKEEADPSQQTGVSKADKYKEFYIGTVDGFNIYEIPKGRKDLYGASCELGSGTEWCTATGKTRHHFDTYIAQGPLFIIVKPGSDEKYQFHYESGQFMDKEDQSII